MPWRSAFLLLTALAAAGCGPAARPPPPDFAIPAEPTAPSAAEAPAEGAPAARSLITNRNPELQFFLPSHPAEVERAPEPVPAPGRSAAPLYTPPYNGPITGYGPGGMAQPPGAPPNPPYPPGGLLGPRR